MASKFLMDIYDDVEFYRDNPYLDLDLFSKLAKKKFEIPFKNKKWIQKIHETMLNYREKFVLNEAYKRKDSSLNKAREVLEAAENLKELYKDVRVWDYYYDTGDSYDVTNGLNTAISALSRMLSYGDPLKSINLKKASPQLVLSYAKQWARMNTGFDDWVKDKPQNEIIKYARMWDQENKKSKIPNIKSAGPELIRSLADIWESGILSIKGETTAWENCYRVQDQKTGFYKHYGEFFDFVWSVYEIFDELPSANQDAIEIEEKVRLQRQALYQRIKAALVSKK